MSDVNSFLLQNRYKDIIIEKQNIIFNFAFSFISNDTKERMNKMMKINIIFIYFRGYGDSVGQFMVTELNGPTLILEFKFSAVQL